MTRKPRKRPSIRRNLLLFAAILLAAGVAIALAANLNRQPRLLLDEDPAFDLARRESPDNAHHTIAAALQNLPALPWPVRTRDRWNWQRIEWTRDAPDPMLNSELAPDSPEWSAFLEQTRAVREQLRPALEKNYYLLHPPVAMSPWERLDIGFQQLGLRLVALGAWDLRRSPATGDGIDILTDAIRLSRRVGEDRGMAPEDPGVEPQALAEIRRFARTAPAREALDRIAAALETLGTPHPNRMPLIENQWRMLDNTLAQRISAQDLNPGRRLAMRFLLRYWQESADWINEHRGQLPALLEGPPRPFYDFLEAQDFRWIDEERRWGPRYAMWRLARAVAAIQSQYHGTRIALALQRHHADHGHYPESLDALAPHYLPEIPQDPLPDAPYAYQNDDTGLRLYSIGEDNVDNNNDPRHDGPLLSIP